MLHSTAVLLPPANVVPFHTVSDGPSPTGVGEATPANALTAVAPNVGPIAHPPNADR